MKTVLAVGQRVFVSYELDPSALWRERLLCGRVSNDRWIVCTPLRDIYLVVVGPRGGWPRGFANPMYRFEDGQGPVGPAELQKLLAEGPVLARAERGDAPDEEMLEVAAEDGVWIFLESRGGHR